MRAMLLQSMLVGAGGFVGALARYSVSIVVLREFPAATFPYATLFVNLLGCLLMGLAAGLAETRNLLTPEARVFVMVGLLGGFTTFSALGFETFAMLRNDEYFRAMLNVSAQVVLGAGLVWAGYTLTAAR
jgi:CrcB protein